MNKSNEISILGAILALTVIYTPVLSIGQERDTRELFPENSDTSTQPIEEFDSIAFQEEQSRHYAELASKMKPPPGEENKPPMYFVAQALGFEMDDPLFEEMVAKNFNFTEIRTRSQSIKYQPVIRHIKGDDGIPFPTEAERKELVSAFDKKNKELVASVMSSGNKSLADQAIKEAESTINQAAKSSMKPKHVPTCDISKREKTDFADIAPGMLSAARPKKGAPLVMDVLFIRVPKPVDSDEYFGAKTKIITITNNEGDAASIAFSNFGLECLPYRARVFDGYTESLYGREALLNFDKEPKGKMHQLVEAKISEFLN